MSYMVLPFSLIVITIYVGVFTKAASLVVNPAACNNINLDILYPANQGLLQEFLGVVTIPCIHWKNIMFFFIELYKLFTYLDI